MRRVVLVLDGSEAMNQAADLLPTRLLAVWKPVALMAAAYLEVEPVARMSVVVLRDGIARRVCAPTSNAEDVAHAILTKYADPKGSGVFSLANGLQALMAEFGDALDDPFAVSQKRHNAESGVRDGIGSSEGNRTAVGINASNAEVILVCGSVTTIDAVDVFKLIETYCARFNTGYDANSKCYVGVPPVHVISLDGAPNVLQHLAAATKGDVSCPINGEHFARLLLARLPSASAAVVAAVSGGGLVSSTGDTAGEEPAATATAVRRTFRVREQAATARHGAFEMVKVGLIPAPDATARADGSRAAEIAQLAPCCPQCLADCPSLPAPCRQCGLALLDETVAALDFLAHKSFTWLELDPLAASSAPPAVLAADGSLHCTVCRQPSRGRRLGPTLLQCDLCEPSGRVAPWMGVCEQCVGRIEAAIHICPLCGADGT
jgi:hypothetical protein